MDRGPGPDPRDTARPALCALGSGTTPAGQARLLRGPIPPQSPPPPTYGTTGRPTHRTGPRTRQTRGRHPKQKSRLQNFWGGSPSPKRTRRPAPTTDRRTRSAKQPTTAQTDQSRPSAKRISARARRYPAAESRPAWCLSHNHRPAHIATKPRTTQPTTNRRLRPDPKPPPATHTEPAPTPVDNLHNARFQRTEGPPDERRHRARRFELSSLWF